MSCRTLELILRVLGVLEEFRQENSTVLFVFFVNYCGSHLRRGSSNCGPGQNSVLCLCLFQTSVGTQSFVSGLFIAASALPVWTS